MTGRSPAPQAAPVARRRWLVVLVCMLKIGMFTWGGGFSIVAQIQQEFVVKRGWLSDAELMDQVTIARSLPGIMIANVGVLFGYHIGGPVCAAAALLGLITPAFAVMILVSGAYVWMRENPYVARAMVGIRAAVVPILASAALRMAKTALVDRFTWALVLAGTGVSILLNLHQIIIVLLGAALGLLWKGLVRRESVP